MLNPLKQAQRRVDIACGYALGAYIGVTLTWISILPGSGFAFFALLIAAVAGFFGTLRTLIRLPLRFWIIPLTSLLYLSMVPIAMGYGVAIVAVGLGVVYSTVYAYLIYRLFKHDFAKTIPPWVCKGCGYPLLGLTEPSCPGCGQRFDLDDVPKVSELPQTSSDRLQ